MQMLSKKMSHSQKGVTFTVTSVTGVLTMQIDTKICIKYLKNWLADYLKSKSTKKSGFIGVNAVKQGNVLSKLS